MLFAIGCSEPGGATGSSPATTASGAAPARVPEGAEASAADQSGRAPTAAAPGASAPSAAASSPAPPRARRAPSLAMSSPIDARDEASLGACQVLRTGQAKRSLTCGEGDFAAPDFARFEESALPLDEATRAHVVAVAKRGKALGRNPRSFGLVGDSITVSRDFLAAFAATSRSKVEIDPALAPPLSLPDGVSVLDFFRGELVEESDGVGRDPFSATRAAKVGARAPWALDGGDASPVARLVADLSPAIAIVSYGANDASYRTAPPEDLAAEFEKNILAVVRDLERRGVVVILENEMRHGDQPGVKACPSDDPRVNDWRLAVGTNATCARAAEIALRDHLPFVDVRYALDGATNHGLGPDGVHPSVHRGGGGLLTREGLDCGYNIRSLVTLVELSKVVSVLEEAGVFPRGAARREGVTTRRAK